MKKIFAFSAAVCLALSAAGCGDEKSSSDPISGTAPEVAEEITTEAETAEETSISAKDPELEEETSASAALSDEWGITDVVKNEDGLNYHLSKCGNFLFGISDELDIIDVANYDISFTNGTNGVVSMLSYSGYHDTVKSLAGDVVSGFEEMYDNVVSKESTINGVPCLDITAETTAADADATKMKIRFSALQYGNGDIINLMYTCPREDSAEFDEYYQQLLDSIEYLGEPLKTEDETFSNEYYTVTASPMWYIEETDGRIKLGLNLKESIDDIWYAFMLPPPGEKNDAREAAETAKENQLERSFTVSSEIDDTVICGYDA